MADVLTAAILFLWASLGMAGNVLIIHPVYTGSHVLTLRTVADNMASRGHRVTVVHWKDSHPPLPNLHENVTDIVLTVDNQAGWLPFLTQEKEARFEVPARVMWNWGLQPIVFPVTGFLLLDAHCRTLLSNTQLINYLQDQEYDVALVDLLYNECSLALMHNLGVPSVGYWAFSLSTGEADITTAPLPPSHVPMMTTTMSDRMSFLQRVYNHVIKLASIGVMLVQNHVINRVVQMHFPGTPSPMQLVADINGLLINSDFCFDYPRAMPPTFINVGGLQIKDPRPLPKDLSEFIEGSGKAGVVLFTMGYIFHSSVVPDTMVRAFMDAFSRLEQRVVVKFDAPFNNTPPNVRIYNFVPQQDVLAHPKTRAFLTHCGMHGMMEAIYYGVPVVGMPIFLDQGDTLQRAIQKGIGVGISKDSDAEEIYQALRKVLRNPRLVGQCFFWLRPT